MSKFSNPNLPVFPTVFTTAAFDCFASSPRSLALGLHGAVPDSIGANRIFAYPVVFQEGLQGQRMFIVIISKFQDNTTKILFAERRKGD